MPTPREVLEAIHGALRETNMEIPSLNSLDSNQLSMVSQSCVNFAGAVLERLNTMPSEWPSSQYIYPSGLFLYVSVRGEPSHCNHAFCVYFHNHLAYVIQVYIGRRIRMITPISIDDFATCMGQLRSDDPAAVAAAYQRLSSVDISAAHFRVGDINVAKA